MGKIKNRLMELYYEVLDEMEVEAAEIAEKTKMPDRDISSLGFIDEDDAEDWAWKEALKRKL